MDKSTIIGIILLAGTLISGILMPSYSEESFNDYMIQADGRAVDEMSTVWFQEFQKQQNLGHDYKKADEIATEKVMRRMNIPTE